MNVIMPIYTVAILVFFIYTIIKILFKNKTNEEEEEDEDFMNSDYYKNHLAQVGLTMWFYNFSNTYIQGPEIKSQE